jgi:hypothetical protein
MTDNLEKQPVLLVFDFDRSLIDIDSDHAVLSMDPEMYNRVMANRGKDGIPLQWTDLMACLLR